MATYVDGETVDIECITSIDSRNYLKPNYSSMSRNPKIVPFMHISDAGTTISRV
jgi:hypothetical protein